MASQIAYAPPANLDNTLLGSLMPAVELSQRMKMQQAQQALMAQELQQSAQLFPAKLQAIQTDQAIKQQQLAEAQQTSGFRVSEEQSRALQMKAGAQQAQVMADGAQKLQDALLEIDKQRGQLLKTQNKYAGPEAQQGLDLGKAQLQAQGLSNEAAKARNNVLGIKLMQDVRSGELGIQQQMQQLDQGTAQLSAMHQQLEANQAKIALDALDHMKAIHNPAARIEVVNQLKDLGGMYKFLAENPNMLSDENLLPLKERLQNNLMKDPQLGPSLMGVQAPQDVGLISGPDGKPMLGPKRGQTESAFQRVLSKTLIPPKQQEQQEQQATPVVGEQKKTSTVFDISNQKAPTNDKQTSSASSRSYHVNMDAVNAIGDDNLSRSIYHATQQTSLDKQPISVAGAYPEFQNMIKTQPLSGVVTANDVKDTSRTDGNYLFQLNNVDRTLASKYMNASMGIGVDKNKPEASVALGYDPAAKPSQVLAFRAIVDGLAKAKADYFQQTGETSSGSFGSGFYSPSSTDDYKLTRVDNPKQGELANKILTNKKLLAKLTPTQYNAIGYLAQQYGFAQADEKGGVRILSPKEIGTTNFADNDEE